MHYVTAYKSPIMLIEIQNWLDDNTEEQWDWYINMTGAAGDKLLESPEQTWRRISMLTKPYTSKFYPFQIGFKSEIDATAFKLRWM